MKHLYSTLLTPLFKNHISEMRTFGLKHRLRNIFPQLFTYLKIADEEAKKRTKPLRVESSMYWQLYL